MGFKEKMMNGMMEGFFSKMSGEEKQSMMNEMMEKFLGGMSQEEKQKMMQDMMPKMMGSMMGDGKSNPMGSMMGMMSSMMGGKGGSMMDMMKNMMGGKKGEDGKEEMPWDMCKKMMSNMSDGVEIAKFATPELRGMFDEWLAQIEEEVLSFIKKTNSTDNEKIAKEFKLSKDSIDFILTRLSKKNNISLKVDNI